MRSLTKTNKGRTLVALAIISFFGVYFSLYGGTWANLGKGSWRDAMLTWSIVTFVAASSWILVLLTKGQPPQGSSTSWVKIARTALFTLGVGVGLWLLVFLRLGSISSAAYALAIASLIIFLGFIVWAVAALIQSLVKKSAISLEVTGDMPWEKPVPFTTVPSASSWRDRRFLIVGVLVALLVSVLLFGDQWIRSRATADLNKVVASTESILIAYNSLQSNNEGIWNSYLNDYGYEKALSTYIAIQQDRATRLATGLRVLGADVQSVGIVPWHRDLTRFRHDYASYIEANISYSEFNASVQKVEDLSQPNPHTAAVNATYSLSQRSMRDMTSSLFDDSGLVSPNP